MTFSVDLASYPPLSWVQAPILIWLAAVGLFVGTMVGLLSLGYLVRRERRLYQSITRDLRTIKSKYSSDLRNGLPLAGYDEIGQCFETTPLAPFWETFAAQFVKRDDATGTDLLWTSQSAKTVFNEASVLASRLNRNFYTAIPAW